MIDNLADMENWKNDTSPSEPINTVEEARNNLNQAPVPTEGRVVFMDELLYLALKYGWTDEETKAVDALIIQARLGERREVALDNYRGHTFSEDTNWWGAFEKFTENNEKVIAALESQLGKK